MVAPKAKTARLKQLWLLFAQAVTVGCAAALVWKTFFPAPEPSPAPNPPKAEDPLEKDLALLAMSGDYSNAVSIAAPSVVNIFTRKTVRMSRADELGVDWNQDPELHLKALGSGVIVSPNGDILTNFHVVDGIRSIFVALSDGRTYEATLRGNDVETDLALLQVKAKDLPAIRLGDSSELRVGQTVLAIGNPFDVGQTVTSDIISALGRHGFGLNNYEDFIQTDAAINQGNSGGALVNLRGELIGINSAIFSPDHVEGFVGIGFAIPSSIVSTVLPAMMAGQTVERGYIGLVPRQLSQELAQDLSLRVRSGVMVKQVIPNSPAAKADIRSFDVILEVNGQPIARANRLLQIIARLKPGTDVEVKILRGNRTLTKHVVASQRPRGSLEKEAIIPSPAEEEGDFEERSR